MTFTKAYVAAWAVLFELMSGGANLTAAQSPVLVPLEIHNVGSYLGVTLADIDPERAKELKLADVSGAEIVSVLEGTPAFQSGLRPNDVVLSYNGENVLGKQQLARLVAETPAGRRVNLVCWRAGKKQQISVTTGSFHQTGSAGFLISTSPVTDVPSTIMIWRNLTLGIESEAISDQLAQSFGVRQGILIWTVAPSSPAEHAGLKAGDVLTEFCGHSIHSPREVGLALQQLQAASNKPITMGVIRDHKPVLLSISADGAAH